MILSTYFIFFYISIDIYITIIIEQKRYDVDGTCML